MNREMEKRLKKIDEKIEKAKEQRNYFLLTKLMAERNDLFKVEEVKLKTTLLDASKDMPVETRRDLTKNIIVGIIIADILRSATMDIEEKFKKVGISGIPLMDELRGICRHLSEIIATIDKVGNQVFTENYIEIADEIELKCMCMIKNYVTNEVMKRK